MFVMIHNKKQSCNHMEMDSEICLLGDSFRIDRHKIRQIFFGETLVKIDSLEILAMEPDMDVCLMMHHLPGKDNFCVLPALQAIKTSESMV